MAVQMETSLLSLACSSCHFNVSLLLAITFLYVTDFFVEPKILAQASTLTYGLLVLYINKRRAKFLWILL